MGRFVSAATLALALVLTFAVHPAAATDAVVSNCSNDVELRSKLGTVQGSGGGTITFNCGTASIAVLSPLEIAAPVTIKGGNSVTISGSNSSRIFVVYSAGVLTLQDIVLTNGFSAGDGGAVYSEGWIILKHATIKNSLATFSGGAIVSYGQVNITDSEIHHNKGANGGALYPRFASSLTIQNSQIHDNQTTSGSDGWGGAILLWDGADAAILDSSIYDNTARKGGAVYFSFANSSLSLQDSELSGNTATAGEGGAVFAGGPLTSLRVTITGNKAETSGGGISYRTGSSASIDKTTFSHNTAVGDGGGMQAYFSSGVTIRNSTFAHNVGSFGGAFSNVNSTASLVNVTIAYNSAVNAAGGINNSTSENESTTLKNTLLAGSEGGDNCEDNSDTLASADGNVSDDASCASFFSQPHDLQVASALLGELASNGGTTETIVPQPGSPAVDGGVPSGLPDDQRGQSRPLGDATDVGAVEVVPCSGPAALCGDVNASGGLTASDALGALRAAVGSVTCALWLCDFNGNGSLAASDALGILRRSVGQPIEPACPPKWDCRAPG